MTAPRFNKVCLFKECDRWRRSDDVFCKPCYMSLPTHMRNMLWSKDPTNFRTAVKTAIQYLTDRWNNIPVTPEEGP